MMKYEGIKPWEILKVGAGSKLPANSTSLSFSNTSMFYEPSEIVCTPSSEVWVGDL